MKKIIEFSLNQKTTRIEVSEKITLLTILREYLGLTGTKCGCDTGDCGVCAVIMDKKLIYSCQVRAMDLPGHEVITIEGIHDADGGPNDLQRAFLKHGAVQCGFCIPAMVLAGEALLLNNPDPCKDEIREAISKVLCRCTGYKQIEDAIEETALQRQAAYATQIIEGNKE